MKAIALALLFTLVGCSQHKPMTPAEREKLESQLLKHDVEDSVGRYQFYPRSGDMPAVLLDTATGCLETVEKWTLDNPPGTPLLMRKYADNVMGQFDSSGKEPVEIPNTRPPKRCGAPQ
jgi:hypothetical protein